MLIAPGKHKIIISLPGYQSFELEVTPLPNSNFNLRRIYAGRQLAKCGPRRANHDDARVPGRTVRPAQSGYSSGADIFIGEIPAGSVKF